MTAIILKTANVTSTGRKGSSVQKPQVAPEKLQNKEEECEEFQCISTVKPPTFITGPIKECPPAKCPPGYTPVYEVHIKTKTEVCPRYVYQSY